ncbi:chromate transporter [Christensenellaceae bacterium OttesenSCG-928-M15]|nr:chromate transporter [Christensenellaceae bacterium OttesenSCG-928-M15]
MDMLLLCWEFFKTGLFAVGGGMATIPFLTDMSKAHPAWFSLEMLADMIAVSESTPGPIGVNMATYVGFTMFGVPGSILATFSLVLPSFIVIILIARALDKFRSNPLVDAGFRGLRPAVTGLIAAAGYSVLALAIFENGTLHVGAAILYAVLMIAMHIKPVKRLHPVVFIALSAVVGIIAGL